MAPRYLDRPQVPFTGLGLAYRLLFDRIVIIGVLLVIAVSLLLPMTAAEARVLAVAIIPIVVWRSRSLQ